MPIIRALLLQEDSAALLEERYKRICTFAGALGWGPVIASTPSVLGAANLETAEPDMTHTRARARARIVSMRENKNKKGRGGRDEGACK